MNYSVKIIGDVARSPRLRPYIGYVCGIAAAAIYGGMAVLGKKIATDFSSPLVASSFSLFFGLIITGLLFGQGIVREATSLPKVGWVSILGAGTASAFGVSCWYLALASAPVVVVAPVVAVYPLVTISLAIIFLKDLEEVTRRTFVAAGLVVLGVILVGIGS